MKVWWQVEVVLVDEFELSEQLLSCVTKIRRVLDERLKTHGASVARKRVLGALVPGPMRQGALATAFEVAPRTITELVDGLERDGLVERQADPDDRRARLVFLTGSGRRVNELAIAARAEVIKEIFADLSAEQRGELSRTLDAVSTRVTAMTATPAPDPAAPGSGVPLNALTLSDDSR
ncbi:MarR family transcriptional regulator [Streptomyces sp. BE308]|uniref:MarR family winged helix-turn-helix transcriptional regulator n=1 Tax=Streptomyces sp. BE308 TaxID=3002529 RepID=UPI002E79CA4A|nr:MarR family transcriptional regulator [Streptomyces sp. BE308]MEE1792960.1 MarR family transcriptional regulator [Streptomyces sp. BE308]